MDAGDGRAGLRTWTCGRSVGVWVMQVVQVCRWRGGRRLAVAATAALEMHHLVPKLGMWVWVAPSRSVEQVARRSSSSSSSEQAARERKRKTNRAATRQGSWLAGLASSYNYEQLANYRESGGALLRICLPYYHITVQRHGKWPPNHPTCTKIQRTKPTPPPLAIKKLGTSCPLGDDIYNHDHPPSHRLIIALLPGQAQGFGHLVTQPALQQSLA